MGVADEIGEALNNAITAAINLLLAVAGAPR